MAELGEPISERELDVLNCLAEGASNREIADQLSISHNTVKVHMRNIFTKLGVSSRTEATTVALQKGMLSIPGLEAEHAQDENGNQARAQPDALETVELVAAEVAESSRAETGGAVGTARRSEQRFFSRRQLLGVIGLLLVLILVLAFSSLWGENPQSPLSPTTMAADAASTSELFEETALGENWVASRPLPQARSHMAVATVGLNVYAISGESAAGVDNRVLIFDSQQQQWREGAPKLTAVAGAATAVLAGEIYVAGGYGENGEAITAVEAYSPLNNAWRPLTALPRRVAGAVAVVSDDRLYLFGGEDGEAVLADSYVYDPGAQRWQELPAMPTARTMAVGGLLGDKLYVVGGSDGERPLQTCELFDPPSAEWSECPPLQQARAAAGSAVFLNKLYVLGGALEGDDSFGEVYDAAEQSWTTFEIPMLAEAPNWPYVGVSNVETHIYVVGGEHGGQLSDALYVYRPLVHQYFIPAASAGGGE